MTVQVLAAPAKINLHLEILGRRSDGFHELETVFQTIELADRVRVEVCSEPHLVLKCDDPQIPTGSANLAWRAARGFLDRSGWHAGLQISLSKRIPAAAGLGGGSSDAAAVLRACQKLAPRPLLEAELAALALELGSDVPFFLLGGTVHALGRGERVTALPDLPDRALTLLHPGLPCPTPAVFQALTDAERGPRPPLGAERWQQRLGEDGPVSGLQNRLLLAAQRAVPALIGCVRQVSELGRPWILCGSGSTFAVFDDLPGPPPPGFRAIHTRLRTRADLDRWSG